MHYYFDLNILLKTYHLTEKINLYHFYNYLSNSNNYIFEYV